MVVFFCHKYYTVTKKNSKFKVKVSKVDLLPSFFKIQNKIETYTTRRV